MTAQRWQRQAPHLAQTCLFPVTRITLPKAAAVVEAVAEAEVFSLLESFFAICRQVKGKHLSGVGVRIDAMLYPKPPMLEMGWPDAWVGLEVKSYELQDQRKKHATRLLYQAALYQQSTFMINGVEVEPEITLIYPPFALIMRESEDDPMYRDGFTFALGKVAGMFRVLELSILDGGRDFEVYCHGINPWFSSRSGKSMECSLGRKTLRASR